MKIAIHHRKGSFSDHWIKYCEENLIPYKLVDAFQEDIISQLKDCDVFMWHHHHGRIADELAARPILFSLECTGIKVYPNFSTGWHFDDKVAQKYLFESIEAPLIKSYVFYDKTEALNWVDSTSFPKVFKLKGGAGANNVKLVKNKDEAIKLVNISFGKGFSGFNKLNHLKERIRKYKEKKDDFLGIIKGVIRLIFPPKSKRLIDRDKGYIYFQDFIPQNEGDYRIIIIAQKYAYGMKRMNRPNDFRASGSSNFVYERLPKDILKVAFEVSEKLNLQSAAFDFIYDEKNKPVIIEVSYCYGTDGSSKCDGYYTKDLVFHKGDFNPFGWMIEDLIEK